MPIYLLSFLIALTISLIVTPIARWVANKYKVIDTPGPRKIHGRPVPLAGGEAILISISIPLFWLFPDQRELFSILFFGLVFVLFGLIDDAGFKIRARQKIWSHLVFALIFVLVSGIQLNFFPQQWINIILTVSFITFMTNSMNMLDGMDGLVAGITFLAAFFFAVITINSGQGDLFCLCLALMGATLGFLKYNFRLASLFLGESGATLLGFVLAVIAIKLNIYDLWNIALTLGVARLQFISFIIPLIILGIPIFDTYFVFANRFLHRIKFSQPGKDHSHHRIHLMGFSQTATVLTLYALQIILGAIAASMVGADIQQFFSLLLIVAVFFITFTVFLVRVKVYS